MSDDKQHTEAGEKVQEDMPTPEQEPGGTLGRDDGEGKPGGTGAIRREVDEKAPGGGD